MSDDKKDYVRRRLNEKGGKHHCHWPRCEEVCPPSSWGCRKHWFKLPKRIRDKIWAAFRPGQEVTKTPSRVYVEAAREAQDWIKETFPGGEE